MSRITDVEVIKWAEQARKDAIDWAQVICTDDEDRLRDFSSGFSEGWRQAVATLKLHKVIDLESRRVKART